MPKPGLALVLPDLLTPLGLGFQNFSLLCITFEMLAKVMHSLHYHLPTVSLSQLIFLILLYPKQSMKSQG